MEKPECENNQTEVRIWFDLLRTTLKEDKILWRKQKKIHLFYAVQLPFKGNRGECIFHSLLIISFVIVTCSNYQVAEEDF